MHAYIVSFNKRDKMFLVYNIRLSWFHNWLIHSRFHKDLRQRPRLFFNLLSFFFFFLGKKQTSRHRREMAHPFSSLEYCLRIKPDYFFLEEYKSFSFNVGERSIEANPKRVYLRSRDHLVPLAKMSVFVSCLIL